MLAVSFLTPVGALVGLVAVVPLLLLALAARRSARAAEAVGLEPAPTRWLVAGSAVATLGAVVAVAAAQPVAESETARRVRVDAEAYFVVDTSRSMLAARSPSDDTRFERAREAALRLRGELGEVPAGIASLTDRVLPHLFPTPDRDAFSATVTRALAIDTPPPLEEAASRSTALSALVALPRRRYFSPDARRRLVIVLTDAETRPFDAGATAAAFDERYTLLLVRFWDAGDRIWTAGGTLEPYTADPSSADTATRLAAAAGGHAFEEDELGAAATAARRFLGDGPKVEQGSERRPISLAPWVLAAGVLPLGLLLWRRPL